MAAAVNKKKTESKFVSCFADSKPDVDITFRDVLLSRPTDHYLVGIDNFSLTNSTMTMIEPLKGDYETFIRIVRNFKTVTGPPGATGYNTPEALEVRFLETGLKLRESLDIPDYDLTIKTSESILNIQQLMRRFSELAATVSEIMNSGLLANDTDIEFDGYNPAGSPNATQEHLKFDLTLDGRLRITGTRAFWACFSIEVPAVQNQFGLYGQRVVAEDVGFTRLRRYLSVNPESGDVTYNKIRVNTVPITGSQKHLTGADPHVVFIQTSLASGNLNVTLAAQPVAHETITINLRANIYSTLERRVALEVGCSLPIKNSPMIDHGSESPDFVLGRWIWRTDPRVESSGTGGSQRFHGALPACTEYQGAQDRVTYHELQAQAKIQTLRIKLFARVRQFKESDESWGMRVIELPSSATDWWHTRLHFVSKD